jgi:(p)ppGpp synthase/HD superfamily hydrolase
MLVSLQEKYPVFKEPLVARAFNISRLAHDGNHGGSPASSFEKCMSAAAILAELGADEVAVAGALLYDSLDSTMLLESQLRPMLASDQTVDLVKRVSHISYICHRFKQSMPTNSMDLYEAAHEALPECLDLVGLMVAHGPPRALLVRLGVALGELRLCAAAVQENESMVNNEYVQSIARDAMTVWAPLANRLGVWSLKAELEDLGFSCLLPTQYTLLQRCLKKAQEPTALVGIVDSLRSSLQQENIDYVDLSGRPKHLWGVWCKMQKKGYSPERVQDVRGLRIIVRSREECYKALRAVETSWKIVGPSKNYIKEPKKNGYQSLHVIADPGDGHSVEIQIRTDKMHYLAEYGADASHWKYKEGSAQISDASVKLTRPSREKLSCDLAKEANWAKFLTQQHVAVDKKCRPSGSPSEDKSLETIMAGLQEKAKASSKINNNVGAKKGKSFHEYIADSGQAVAPPEESRVLVAVVHQGAFSVQSLPPGSSIADFLETREETHGVDALVQVLVNQQVEPDSSTILQPGDVVELHMEPVPQEPLVGSKASKGNMLPLGNLSKRMTKASLV